MDAVFAVDQELVFYDPDLRRSWQEGGGWPLLNHFNFHETVVAARIILRGYHVLWDYSGPRPVKWCMKHSAPTSSIPLQPAMSAGTTS